MPGSWAPLFLASQPGLAMPSHCQVLPVSSSSSLRSHQEQTQKSGPWQQLKPFTPEAKEFPLPLGRLPPLQGWVEALESGISPGGGRGIPMLSHFSATSPPYSPLPRASEHMLTTQPQFLHRALSLPRGYQGTLYRAAPKLWCLQMLTNN